MASDKTKKREVAVSKKDKVIMIFENAVSSLSFLAHYLINLRYPSNKASSVLIQSLSVSPIACSFCRARIANLATTIFFKLSIHDFYWIDSLRTDMLHLIVINIYSTTK